jgi:hypothetical protein
LQLIYQAPPYFKFHFFAFSKKKGLTQTWTTNLTFQLFDFSLFQLSRTYTGSKPPSYCTAGGPKIYQNHPRMTCVTPSLVMLGGNMQHLHTQHSNDNNASSSILLVAQHKARTCSSSINHSLISYFQYLINDQLITETIASDFHQS